MNGPSRAAQWRLYVLTDRRRSHGRSHVEVAREAVVGGADAIQLRDKAASGRELYEVALDIRKITRRAGVPFLVNDRVDVALAAGADGVHVGQDDLPASAARRVIPEGMILGVSASTLDEALAAERDGADYIGFGPVFDARESKPDALPPVGLARLEEVCRRCSVPIVAIGGVDLHNLQRVLRAGASGAAVISGVVAADDIRSAARAFKELAASTRRTTTA